MIRIRERHLDVLAEDPVQQARHVRHDAIEVDVTDLNRLSSAERQQLPGQGRRPIGVLREFGHGVAQIRWHSLVRCHFLGAPQNHGQDVVEVVCDTASQPSDGLELLGLPQLLLQPLTLGLRDQRREQVCHGEGERLFVRHPPPQVSGVLAGQHSDRHTARTDWHTHH